MLSSSLEQVEAVIVVLGIPLVILTFAVYLTWRARKAQASKKNNKKG